MKAKKKQDELLAEAPTALPQADGSPKAPAAATDDRQARIQQRAYELWLQRGDGDGSAEQDWLQAEAEINAALGTPEPERAKPKSSVKAPSADNRHAVAR